jgi:hypothetical protein
MAFLIFQANLGTEISQCRQIHIEAQSELQRFGEEKEMEGFQGAGFSGLYFNRYYAVLMA